MWKYSGRGRVNGRTLRTHAFGSFPGSGRHSPGPDPTDKAGRAEAAVTGPIGQHRRRSRGSNFDTLGLCLTCRDLGQRAGVFSIEAGFDRGLDSAVRVAVNGA